MRLAMRSRITVAPIMLLMMPNTTGQLSIGKPSLVMLALIVASSLTAAAGAPQHDASVADLIEYFTTKKGVFYSPKQQIRYENGMMGVFATQRIEKGELLCSVPWSATINAGRKISSPPHLVCDTVHNLVKEMRLGDKSEFGPYVQYLLNQRVGQLPSAWSQPAKDLLRRVLDGDGEGDGSLPPEEATILLDQDWREDCDGEDDPLENNAAMLVIQRAEDDLMVPVYDFYNHRNGDYLNTVNHRRSMKSFDVTAAKTIEVGEQIYISYNMCSNCGNRADDFGTPEMFRDYGFVEAMPQRWIFPEHGFSFDLEEEVPGSADGGLELSYPKGGRPKNRFKREWALGDFRRQVMRLKRLKRMEEMKREVQVGTSSSSDTEISDYEWNAIWQYSDAMVNAMQHVIWEEEGSDDDEKEGSALDLYESLDEIESDQLFYKVSPIKYTATCNNEKMLQMDGYKTLEEPTSLYQDVLFFDMPDGDVCLEIDLTIQTCAKYRPHYHELVVDIPARYIDTVRRVLFVGGGDSMILAEAFKYPSLELVVRLELDQVIVRNSFKYFHTQPHFEDKRVQWWFGDAVKSLKLLPAEFFGSFDLVLVDLSETVASLSVSDHLDMLQALALLLRPEGVMIKNEWTYLDKMSTIFKYTARLNMRDVPIMCDQALTMGSQTVDFFNHRPVEHDIKRRLLGPQVDIDDRFHMFHDYQDNDLEMGGTCEALDESSSNSEGDSGAGVLMVLNAENTTIPLTPFSDIESSIKAAFEGAGLEMLSSSVSNTITDGSAASFTIREGYVTVRTWPEQHYAAFDIHLWGAFAKHELIRDALLKIVGSADGSWSSYRVVGGGMLGASTWEEDRKTIGPLSAHAESCSSAAPASSNETRGKTASEQSSAKAALAETLGTIESDEESVFLVICGVEGEDCLAQDVVSTGFDSDSSRPVSTVWTCDGLSLSADAKESQNQMIGCENQVLGQLYDAVFESGDIGIGTIVIDASVPLAMVNIINGILTSRLQQWDLLADQVSFITLMSDDEATMKRKHNFLDRVRKELAYDPLFRAEIVVVAGDGSNTSMEMGILTTNDRDFFPRLYNITESAQSQSVVGLHVRKVLGARWEEQDEDDYNPREYKLEDYDTLPGKEQFSQQNPMGRQSIFQLSAEEDEALSRASIERALFSAITQAFDFVTELKTVAEVGKGFVTIVLSPQGSVHLLWDGATGVHINVFSHDDSEAKSESFIGAIEKQISVKMIQHDEQPRGTGRVVNFSHDVDQQLDPGTSSADASERPMLKYECPTLERGSGQNDIAGYFNYYDKDHERHAENAKDKDYYIKGFRNTKFGGRVWTYSKMKREATEYKAKYYGDALEDGDWIYEGACGEAFNLLMTLEILAEERGIKNLRAFGSDYLAESARVADELFEAQSKANPWIKKGQFCQGDSTDLSFVPANSYDLSFTYVDPMVDPLKRHDDDVAFEKRAREMKKLCRSDDDEDQDIVAFDQQLQENWHSDWVMELIRITKPGKAIIIEDVDTPICDKSSEWGGVATSWWKFAVDEYGWDVDPESIEIVMAPWYTHRYNVFMRKNTKDKSRSAVKNLSREDGPITTCPASYWNEEMHVNNVMEYDVDLEVVSRIWAEYEKDVRPHLNTGNSTEDFCLVTPYNPETVTWEHDDGVVRSDIKWYSTRNEKTFNKYAKFVDELGLKDHVKGTWIDSEDPTIYAIFFIPRSHSEVHQFHEDWRFTAKTQIMTMLVPLNKFDIHLKYYDADNKERDYEYKLGKGIGFAGGFIHTTGLGDGEEEDVLLCVYLGSQDKKIWRIAQNNIADELEYYNSPIKGFIRNENIPDKKVCQYGAQTKYPWKEGKE